MSLASFGAFPGLLPAPTGAPVPYCIKPAEENWEWLGYHRLRREVFCHEQGLFEDSDLDVHDAIAIPIVAVAMSAGMADEVVAAVRIFPCDRVERTWYGSRLAVDQAWRGISTLGAGLIRAAVGTARNYGCDRFLATVQQQNVALFRRLHWNILSTVEVRGRPHALMSADLAFYPPLTASESSTSLPASSGRGK